MLAGDRSARRSQADLAKRAISVHPGINELDVLADAPVRADGREHSDTAAIDIADRVYLPVASNADRPQHALSDVARLELSPRPVSARAIGRIASLEYRPLKPEADQRCVCGLLRRQAVDLPDAPSGRKNLAQMATALLPGVPSQIHTASGEDVEGD